ncbi:MAG: diguanylate cyclase [Thermoleophilia bacterium]
MPVPPAPPAPARIQLRVADPRALSVLAKAAAGAGMEVVPGGSGPAPHVVVAQWPPMEGVTGLLDLRDRPELLAIVPAGDTAAAEDALDAGAGDCIMLPVRAAEAEMRVAAALRRVRERAALADPAAMVDARPTGVAVLDADGRIAQVNPAMERLTGHDADALMGLRVGRDPLLGPDAATVADAFRRARTAGSADAELTVRYAGGAPRAVTARVSASRDDTGTVTAYLLTLRDPTENERTHAAIGRLAAAAAAESPSAVYARLAREAAHLAGVHATALLRNDPQGQRVMGEVRAAHPAGTLVPLDARVSRERVLPCGADEAIVSVPLRVGGREWGQLAVVTGADDREEAVRTLERFARVAALAVADADARAGRLDPDRDPLTGLPGHTTFFARLSEAVASARAGRRPLSLVIMDIDRLKRLNDQKGHEAGDAAVREIAGRLAAAAGTADLVARIGGEEFAWLMDGADAGTALRAAQRLRQHIAQTPVDGVGVVTASFGVSQLGGGNGSAETPGELQRQAEIAVEYAKLNNRNQCQAWSFEVAELVYARRAAMPAETPSIRAIKALAWAVDSKDTNTAKHSQRVAELAVRIARALGWSESRCIQLDEAGIVHDVGKIAVPDAILLKDGPLTEEERVIINRHPEVGARIVADVLSADQAAWVRAHHERWDGGGYPDGLAGEEIPEEARVLALADAFDVMRSPRTYKAARTVAWALDEARANSGTQFWPPAVDALARLVESGAVVDEADAEAAGTGEPAAVAAG